MSHLIAGRSEGISGSIVALSDFFDCGINFLLLSLAPNVRCRFQARFLDGGTCELMQQDAVGVLSARFLRIDVLVLHVLVCEPTFDLLKSM